MEQNNAELEALLKEQNRLIEELKRKAEANKPKDDWFTDFCLGAIALMMILILI